MKFKLGQQLIRGRYCYTLVDAVMKVIRNSKDPEDVDYKTVAPVWKRDVIERAPSAYRFKDQTEEQRDKKLRAAALKRESRRRKRRGF